MRRFFPNSDKRLYSKIYPNMTTASKLKQRVRNAIELCKAVSVDYLVFKGLWKSSLESTADHAEFRSIVKAEPSLREVIQLFEMEREQQLIGLQASTPNVPSERRLPRDRAKPQVPEFPIQHRSDRNTTRYFTVFDDEGNAHSAVEFSEQSWFDDAGKVLDKPRLRRVVRLLASRSVLSPHPHETDAFLSSHPRVKRYRLRAWTTRFE